MAAGVWCEREEILQAILSVGISGGEILRDGWAGEFVGQVVILLDKGRGGGYISVALN